MNTTKSRIKTRDFGEIEISQKDMITFPSGLFAFEDLRNFVIISPLGEGIYPMWLQSAEDEKPCFIVYNPFEIIKDYSPGLSQADKKSIDFSDGDELFYLVIAVVPTDVKKTTVNLKSPIVINRTKSTAAQIILDESYDIKFPIFREKGAD